MVVESPLFPLTDTAMHINTAMFEQSSRSGYVLKPSVMWDKSHVMYGRFNPWDKEFDGLQPSALTIQVRAMGHAFMYLLM